MNDVTENILEIQHLRKYFPVRKGLLSGHAGDVKALDGVGLAIRRGEIFGLVGESGSGKSTLGYTALGIYKPTSGKILFRGVDLAKASRKDTRVLQKHRQIVFQDPGASLNPRKSIAQTLTLPLRVHGMVKGNALRGRLQQLLDLVELPSRYLREHPAALSGGQKQRVAIARALASEPSFIVLDEPTSALDVSVQAKIISLLLKLRSEFDLSYLFITHDLSLIRNVASRVAIMYLGKTCEMAEALGFFQKPLHPYTRVLLASIPVISEEEEELKPEEAAMAGEVPSPVNVPTGCSFHPRCSRRLAICSVEDPVETDVSRGHVVRCHLFERGGRPSHRAARGGSA